MTTTSLPLCAMALSYAVRGWYVIPLHDVTQGRCSCNKGRVCDTPGKHPRLHNWPNAATLEAVVIRNWWQRWPAANVGIVPGKRSGCVVIDVDPRNGGDISLDELQHTYRPLPDTPTVLSGGGGLHYYFQASEDLASIDLAPGINFLADGSHQAVAPPSLHPSGQHYEWEVSSHPDDVPLAPLPDWVIALVKNQVHEREVAAATLPDKLPVVQVATLRISPRMKRVIQLGNDTDNPYSSRSEALAAVYTAMITAGYDDVTIAALVLSPEYGISAKPLSQKNARSPFYWTLTRGWVALDIARVRAKYAAQSAHQQPQNGHLPGPQPPEPAACPELPSAIACPDADCPNLWLLEYVKHSERWAPRAYKSFHLAAGLWILSTVAARRVKVLFGPGGVYPSLYIALAGDSTLFTKTTCADIGEDLLRRTGLRYLLADDDSTPQALMRAMSLRISEHYEKMDALQQQAEHNRLAFAAQKGWYYSEWGNQLQAMMQPHGGVMAGFRSLLRVLDDHKPEYTYSTVSRGRDTLIKPSLSLLASVTPADLQPFAKRDSGLWRDGFLARFAFSVPEKTDATNAQFPRGACQPPSVLVAELDTWHRALGIPNVTVTQAVDEKDRAIPGKFHVEVGPLPETVYDLDSETFSAFYTYDSALRDLIKTHNLGHLNACYGRFAGRALRVAALLAAQADVGKTRLITLSHWEYAVRIVEEWRRDLHKLIGQLQEPRDEKQSRESRQEQLIVGALHRHGALSVREIHNRTRLAYEDVMARCATLKAADVVKEVDTSRTVKYELVAQP